MKSGQLTTSLLSAICAMVEGILSTSRSNGCVVVWNVLFDRQKEITDAPFELRQTYKIWHYCWLCFLDVIILEIFLSLQVGSAMVMVVTFFACLTNRGCFKSEWGEDKAKI